VHRVMDGIRGRFGYDALRIALSEARRAESRNERESDG
jgi:hypothetical protein